MPRHHEKTYKTDWMTTGWGDAFILIKWVGIKGEFAITLANGDSTHLRFAL